MHTTEDELKLLASQRHPLAGKTPDEIATIRAGFEQYMRAELAKLSPAKRLRAEKVWAKRHRYLFRRYRFCR